LVEQTLNLHSTNQKGSRYLKKREEKRNFWNLTYFLFYFILFFHLVFGIPLRDLLEREARPEGSVPKIVEQITDYLRDTRKNLFFLLSSNTSSKFKIPFFKQRCSKPKDSSVNLDQKKRSNNLRLHSIKVSLISTNEQ
jgi:hypothetical protein